MANRVDPDQTAPIGAVCSGSMLFASILNLPVMLGNYLQQTTLADDIFRCIFFLALLRVKRGELFRSVSQQQVLEDQPTVYARLVNCVLYIVEIQKHGQDALCVLVISKYPSSGLSLNRSKFISICSCIRRPHSKGILYLGFVWCSFRVPIMN